MKKFTAYSAVTTLCVFGGLVLFAVSAGAQSVNGRLYSTFFTWEREVFGEDATKHFQTYNGTVIHVKRLGHKDLSFHTYFRFSNDVASEGFSLRNKLYNSYFEWKRLFNGKLDLSFGRQYVWAGVGNGTIDGGKIEIKLNGWGTIGTYAGTLATLRESWKIDSWAESHMMGAYYKNRLLGADYQFSWTRKSRAPVSYTVPGPICRTESFIARSARSAGGARRITEFQ